MAVLIFLGIALGAYFCGGLNGAILSSRIVYKNDVRLHGSNNAGLTNFYRTYGSRAIFLVILIDVIKTALPVVVGGMLLESHLAFGTVAERLIIGRTWGGMFAMIGHAYPCLYKFKGGKAVLSGGTVALFLDLRVFAFVAVVFVLAVAITRYVSLGSVLAGLMFPVAFLVFRLGLWATLMAVCCGAFVIYRHRGNVLRLLKGEERKVSFGRKRREASDGS